jgi:CubicO group peptidase (beta-lactamase class C family)
MIFKNKHVKIVARLVASTFFLCIGFSTYLWITNKTYVFKALWYNLPGIEDAQIFDNDTLHIVSTPVIFKSHTTPISTGTLDVLTQWDTEAFLVLKGDTIVKEYYKSEQSASMHINSFSMAKGIVSLGLFAAISKGYIKGFDQKASDYIVEWKEDGRSEITLRHLLMMTSGLEWNEEYAGLFNVTTEAYYGTDLYSLVVKIKLIDKPGSKFQYKGCDTEILCIVIEKATGMKWSKWVEKNIWVPMRAESYALWSTDRKGGLVKGYCCLHAIATDFAKLGRIVTKKGIINNVSIIDSNNINTIYKEVSTNENQYAYQFWLISDYKGYDIIYMRGILGQFIICIPELDMVVVRLGNKRSKEKINGHYKETYTYIDEALNYNKSK